MRGPERKPPLPIPQAPATPTLHPTPVYPPATLSLKPRPCSASSQAPAHGRCLSPYVPCSSSSVLLHALPSASSALPSRLYWFGFTCASKSSRMFALLGNFPLLPAMTGKPFVQTYTVAQLSYLSFSRSGLLKGQGLPLVHLWIHFTNQVQAHNGCALSVHGLTVERSGRTAPGTQDTGLLGG